VDYEITQIIESELEPLERLLWTGQPDPRRMARSGLSYVALAVPFTAFAALWIIMASGFKWPNFSEPWDFFPLFGLPFLLVGLGMFFSPVWLFFKARRTAYGITDKRVMIVTFGKSKSVKSYTHRDMNRLEKIERADGSGDLVFIKDAEVGNTVRHIPEFGIIGVDHVNEVEGYLEEMMRKSKSS
jgi:hypothetical protein